MAELAAKHLITYGVKTVYVASRTYERAVNLAKVLNGSALSFDAFKEALYRAAPRSRIAEEIAAAMATAGGGAAA